MRKSTVALSIFAALALCVLMANFSSSVQAQRIPSPAPNDLCVDAIAVGSVSRTRFDTTGATRSADDPCISCAYYGVGQNDKSIWYSIAPPAGSVVRVSTQGSDYDTVLAVWQTSGGCPTGSSGGDPKASCTNDAGVVEIACNDDSNSTLQSDAAFYTNGSTYYIEVAECTGTGYGYGGVANVTISSALR